MSGLAYGSPLRWRGYHAALEPEQAEEETPDMADVPLDPIPEKVVGACRTKALVANARELGLFCLLVGLAFLIELQPVKGEEWSRLATDTLADLGKELCTRRDNKSRRIVATHAKYRSHFTALEVSKILRRARGRPRFVSSYFAVLKARRLARAIFNGRRLSSLTRAPPPVNLPSLKDYVPMVTQFLNDHPRVYVCGGDLRHWFHQLMLGSDWAPYFGLSMDGDFFTWQTVPMGWSFSPFIAQSATLMLLCGRHATGRDLFCLDELKDPRHGLPKFLFRKEEGRIVSVGMVSMRTPPDSTCRSRRDRSSGSR